MHLPILPPDRILGEKPSCKGCAHCCKHIAIPIDKPRCKEDYNNIIWYLLHEKVVVFCNHENEWFVQFYTTCKGLDGLRCGVYPGRPSVCKDYDVENCERHGEDSADKYFFSTAEQFMSWLKKKKIDYKFKWQKEVKYP